MAGALLPLALMFGGYLANEQATRKVKSARNDRFAEELDRQKALGDQSQARLREAIAGQERPAVEQDASQAAAVREQKYAAVAPSGEGYVANPSAPTEVKSEIASRMVDALRKGRQQSQALAKLGGRSDAQLGGQIDLGRSAGDINSIGRQSRASSAILPYELQDANAEGEDWSTIADLFNLASMGTGMYGMTQAPAGIYGGAAYGGSTGWAP